MDAKDQPREGHDLEHGGTPGATERAEASTLDAPALAAFEQQLRSALRPVDPPVGFAERVLARAESSAHLNSYLNPTDVPARAQQTGGQVLAWRSRRGWVGGAIAAALVAGVLAGTSVEHHRAEARRSAEATAQFQTAEQITDRALQQAQAQIVRAGVQLGD